MVEGDGSYIKIARAVVVPARVGVDKPRGVELPDTVDEAEFRVAPVIELAPALVVDDPHVDARVTLVLVDQELELAVELGLLCGVGLLAQRQRGHVLDHEEAELVAGAVEERGLNLDMLAHHVEAVVQEDLEVVHHRFAVGRRVDAVRPEALVQRAELENELVIDEVARDAVDGALGDCPETGVRLDLVGAQAHDHVVKVTLAGAPELRGGDVEAEGLARSAGSGADFGRCAGLEDGHGHFAGVRGGTEDGHVDCVRKFVSTLPLQQPEYCGGRGEAYLCHQRPRTDPGG